MTQALEGAKGSAAASMPRMNSLTWRTRAACRSARMKAEPTAASAIAREAMTMAVAADELGGAVGGAGAVGRDRLIVEPALDVRAELGGGGVPARGLFFHRLP